MTSAASGGDSAIRTLERLGYTFHGGEQWKPPLGPKPDFDLNERIIAEVEKVCAEIEARYRERQKLSPSEISVLTDDNLMYDWAARLRAAGGV